MSRIFITGDTHGVIDLEKLNSHNFVIGQNLTKEDYVIVLGDFGCLWDGDILDFYVQTWYNEKPWTTLFVDGNHENHYMLDRLPVEEWKGGKIHKISDSIFHLMRGQVFTINDKTFFTMGGAVSQDKSSRKENVTWWEREVPSFKEFNEGLDNLSRVNNKVNYILSHDAPDYVRDLYGYKHDIISNYLQTVEDTVEFEKHFCGHYHMDKTFLKDKLCIVYNNIYEL